MIVDVWTDGACSNNQVAGDQPGGWGFYAEYQVNGEAKTFQKSGYDPATTNNRMELTAVLEVVKAVDNTTHLNIHTDSGLVIGWLSQGWKRNDKKIAELCSQIETLCTSKSVTLTFIKVKGHSGNRGNEIVDKLAVEAYKNRQ